MKRGLIFSYSSEYRAPHVVDYQNNREFSLFYMLKLQYNIST